MLRIPPIVHIWKFHAERLERVIMYKALSPGAINVKCPTLKDAIAAAARYEFGGVEFAAGEVADLVDKTGAAAVKKMFGDAGVKPAGAGLAVEWRGGDDV